MSKRKKKPILSRTSADWRSIPNYQNPNSSNLPYAQQHQNKTIGN